MFITTLFNIAKIWKQTNCPSTHEWIKMCVCVCVCVYTYICMYMYVYIHICMEYYSAIKKNEISPCATTRMDLEGITLSEIKHTETNSMRYPLYVEIKK